jgi:hypothetical protein
MRGADAARAGQDDCSSLDVLSELVSAVSSGTVSMVDLRRPDAAAAHPLVPHLPVPAALVHHGSDEEPRRDGVVLLGAEDVEGEQPR